MKAIKQFISSIFGNEGTPPGVKALTAVTSIRWIGWGFAESLVPVFLFSFGNSYAEAGMLQSTYIVALILSLPVLGILADRIRATTLVAIGLVLYVFIGVSYFLAGLTGLVLYVVIARAINGVAYGMDTIGRDTYFRRNVVYNKVATAFGYQDTITNFWWIAASLSGIVLVKFFSIPQLLLMIAPFALIALLVLMRFRKRDTSEVTRVNTSQLKPALVASSLPKFSWALRGVAVTYFFISFASAVVMFFVPIQAYAEGASLSLIILMGVVITLPMLFGLSFGRLFNRKGHRIFPYGIGIFALLILGLAFFQTYAWQLVFVFLIALAQEFLVVSYQELVTVHSVPEHYGKTSGILRSLTNIGNLTGPLVVGTMMDQYGTRMPYIVLSVVMLFLAFVFWYVQKRAHREVEAVIKQA